MRAKYSICIANGTAAIYVACKAATIGEIDEVIITPMTFAASEKCVLYYSAKPVFADINPKTYNIASKKQGKYVTNRILFSLKTQHIQLERSIKKKGRIRCPRVSFLSRGSNVHMYCLWMDA